MLDTERQGVPRSVLHYRPIVTDQADRPGPLVSRKSRFRADVRSPVAQAWPDDLDLEEEEIQPPRQRANAPAPRLRRRFYPLFLVGLALLVMLLGWVSFSAFDTWWQTTQDDWHYGRPRTFQIDQVVGHHDSPSNPSHFIAMNLNRHVLIVEFPGGDPAKSIVYSGPILLGLGQDLTPVVLSFQDRNHDGKLDMVATVADSQLVFLNGNGIFVSPIQNSTG